MNYAVFQSGGKQYKAKIGDVLELERLKHDGKSVVFDQVLLQVDGDNVTLGTPFIPGAQVKAEIKEDKRGEKIDVLRYRSKSRYRRRVGHRQELTVVEIKDFASKKASPRENKANS